jgi:hypothetical protein
LTNVMAHLTSFIAAQFSAEELTPINAHLDTSGGGKEYKELLALVYSQRGLRGMPTGARRSYAAACRSR